MISLRLAHHKIILFEIQIIYTPFLRSRNLYPSELKMNSAPVVLKFLKAITDFVYGKPWLIKLIGIVSPQHILLIPQGSNDVHPIV